LVVMLILGLSGTSAPTGQMTESNPGSPEAKSSKVASYRAQFQGPTPAPGWQYLWNAKGPIGNPANYQPLLWIGKEYNTDGKGPIPRADPGAYLRLMQDNGHPGRGVVNSAAKLDYCAIAAYTIQPGDGPGYYRLANSVLRGGNGLE